MTFRTASRNTLRPTSSTAAAPPTRIATPARLLGVLVVVAAVASCAEPFEFVPWLLPVPQDAAKIGYRDIPLEDRGRRIELVPELVIGPRGDDPDYLLGDLPPRLAVAEDGHIFVLDTRNRRVQLFDPAGELVRSFGRPGQGPGEFVQAAEVFIEDGLLFVRDVAGRRVSVWNRQGEVVDNLTSFPQGGMWQAVGPGRLAIRRTERRMEGQDTVFEAVRYDGSVEVEYARYPWPERVIDPPLEEIVNSEPGAFWAGTVPPAFAAAADGTIYMSPFAEYQVFAFAPGGTMRWAVQVDRPRPPLQQVEIDHHMVNHRRRFPERAAHMIDWPDRQYALGDVRVDGHGHLYVFPYVAKGTAADEPRPVDVFDPDGMRLFTGTISSRMFSAAFATYNGPMLEVAWQVARGDRVWGLTEHSETGDYQVVRWRLDEPF